MPSPQQLYHGSVRALSALFIALGVGIVALTLARGGGPLSIGVLMGLGFVVVGCGRLYVASRMRE